jgi:hypothetical protein
LIVIAGAVAATGGVVAYANKRSLEQRLAKRLKNQKVSILGAEKVGKSSLLAALRRPKRDNMLPPTSAPPQGEFTMQIGGAEVSFVVPRDLPSNPGVGGHIWKDAFQSADHVWYLFRADLLARADSTTIERVRDDVSLLSAWMKNANPPKVTLIGTWADADPAWEDDPSGFAERVSSATPIDIAQVLLHKAPVVVGSLETPKNSRRLLDDLARSL